MKEVIRILKPKGVFLLSDLNKFSTSFFAHTLGVKHPLDAQFDWLEFIRGLQDAGFVLLQDRILDASIRPFLVPEKIIGYAWEW